MSGWKLWGDDNGKDVDAFLQLCHNDYENMMDTYFYTAKDIRELESGHRLVKAEILEQLPQKWKMQPTKSAKLSDKTVKKVTKKLDDALSDLKIEFEKSRKRQDESVMTIPIQQNAVAHYNKEMDTFMQNNRKVQASELDSVHGSTVTEVIARAKLEGGDLMGATAVKQLKEKLEDQYKFYQSEVKMNQMSLKDPAIGIDLGTTMCCVMVYYNGAVELVPNLDQGSARITPSYVAYSNGDEGEDTFGVTAKEQAYRYPENTIYDAKRIIGRPWSDRYLQANMRKWPFELVNDNGNPKIRVGDRTRFPHEISARLLAHFRKMTEDHLGMAPGTIKKAVITVPAYFSEPQRRATREAATCAGLEVLNILSEPTAAAIAYSWKRRDTSGTRNALVYDLGGGTFDVAIARIRQDDIDILGVDGDTDLGGEDFDQTLMQHVIDEFKRAEGVDLTENVNSDIIADKFKARSNLARIKAECEKAKIRLSTSEKTKIQVDHVFQEKDLVTTITRDKFEDLLLPVIDKTLRIVDRALEGVRHKGISSKENIDDVILIGGSTRMPLVTKEVMNYFRGKQLCKYINPDEAVAYGAAVQAAQLNRADNIKSIHIQDVTPFTLGVETVNDTFAPLIEKNSNIPCSHKEFFTTTLDYQTNTKINVYQGESEWCSENMLLGEFLFEGLPPGPAGKERIEIIMTIDSMGILQVEAVSVSTGKTGKIMITATRLGMDNASMKRVMEETKQITGELRSC